MRTSSFTTFFNNFYELTPYASVSTPTASIIKLLCAGLKFTRRIPINNEQLKTPSRRPKTMSPAALAANRANAKKSTGPRTPAGKIKAASNALQHGLYSPASFEKFVADNQLALEVITNTLEQYRPITPAEHFLTHQLIHMQLRFLQMQFLYSHAMDFTVHEILTQPTPLLNQILRELNSLPRQITRTMKELRAEQARREQNDGIEPIPNQPDLPPTDPIMPDEPLEGQPSNTEDDLIITPRMLFDVFAGRVLRNTAMPENTPNEPITSTFELEDSILAGSPSCQVESSKPDASR